MKEDPRLSIQPGRTVDIIQKEDQHSGKRSRGIVQEILTNSLTHSHGIKMQHMDNHVGRIVEIVKIR
jgi:uncharacterized repeat protein (TIGR03833 family)